MVLQSCLLCETVQLVANDHVLLLNSAADPFVSMAAQHVSMGTITLAEDNIASVGTLLSTSSANMRHVAFHDYILRCPAATMDVAAMNLLYQPSNAWMYYGLQVALYALRVGGRLYVTGAKDRGILSVAKRMQEYFGNVETLTISKGQRVLCSYKATDVASDSTLPAALIEGVSLQIFADSKLDEGTRLLLDALDVHITDEALDIGSGAGFIGLHIARLASRGHVTMVDASLAAVAATQQAVAQSGLTNVRVLPSDGAQAVITERFDLVVTNPPFHQGGIQTTAIAERFIREAAQVLRPQGRFYLVANRFLKYEPTLRACFKKVEEVGGNTRYKVLRAV
ncbi:MAG: class I SAM-dependent methyltransferase [Chloroflexi bacterium]|nr:class I SAM-dependent methyltransferase [Chloroflexota bacterium]